MQIRIWKWSNGQNYVRVWREKVTYAFTTTDSIDKILNRYPHYKVIEVI